MDAKKIMEGARRLREHQNAVNKVNAASRKKDTSLLEGLKRIALEGLEIKLTPRR